MYYFTPLPGYFSPFPHGTSPLSVTREYSGLAGGPARFTPNFTGSVLLGIRSGRPQVFVYGALTLYGDPFQRPSTNPWLSDSPHLRQKMLERPTTPTTQRLPAWHATGLASSAFARHYSRNHGCFLFLWVLRCFTSPRSLHTPYVFRRGSHHMTGAGFPHSDILGSTLGWQLPEAYRSLLRPSSAPGGQASTVWPSQLDHTNTPPPTHPQPAPPPTPPTDGTGEKPGRPMGR